jgi:hypothetical protein
MLGLESHEERNVLSPRHDWFSGLVYKESEDWPV